MKISERASYIRGLMEGLELDRNAKETKILNAVTELLSDISLEVEELEARVDELSGQVDEIDEDLGSLETEVYDLGDEDEDDECGCGCGCGHHHHEHETFEVNCPSCGKTIELTDEMLDEDSIVCPGCGATLEFEFEDDDEDEGCSCPHCSAEEHENGEDE